MIVLVCSGLLAWSLVALYQPGDYAEESYDEEPIEEEAPLEGEAPAQDQEVPSRKAVPEKAQETAPPPPATEDQKNR